MATQNIPFSFTNGTNANANEVNSNFQAIKTFNESQVVHVDGAVQATTNSYANLSVTGGKIAAATITSDKFASGIQPVIVVASVGALPTGVDGMVAYVNSNNADEGLYTFNGTAWRRGAGWNSPWGIVGYSAKTTDQTVSSTTYVDATSLSANFTAVANRYYRTKAYVRINVNTAGILDIQLTDGGATVQYQASSVTPIFGAAGGYVIVESVNTFSAGARTAKIRAKVDAGNSIIQGATNAPSFIIVEDLGSFGAPT